MTEPTDFRIEQPRPDLLKIVGEFDVATAHHLDAALEPLDGAHIDVDLSALKFADSSGLRALVRARRNHHGVRFVRPTAGLVRLVQITGLVEALDLDTDEDTDAERPPPT